MTGETTVGAFVLWHRTSRRRPWAKIASAGSEPALTRLLPGLPSGESIVLPAGEHPNDRRKAADRRSDRPGPYDFGPSGENRCSGS